MGNSLKKQNGANWTGLLSRANRGQGIRQLRVRSSKNILVINLTRTLKNDILLTMKNLNVSKRELQKKLKQNVTGLYYIVKLHNTVEVLSENLTAFFILGINKLSRSHEL
jgi:hypothetical protein